MCTRLRDAAGKLLLCACDLRLVRLQGDESDSLNEDETPGLALLHVVHFCTCTCARIRGSVCLSSNGHPPLCTRIPNAISSLALTRLTGLPSVIWSVALVPVACSNDSFCRKKNHSCFRMKSREEEEKEDESVTRPPLYSCSLIQFHGADLTKARTRAP